jgi:hypothetical protein
VAPDDRIRELCAQLLRTRNPLVIQMVADQLKAAIDVYAESVQGLPRYRTNFNIRVNLSGGFIRSEEEIRLRLP